MAPDLPQNVRCSTVELSIAPMEVETEVMCVIDRLSLWRPWRHVLLTDRQAWLLWRQRRADVLRQVRRRAWHSSSCRLSVRRQGVVVSSDAARATQLLLVRWNMLRHVRQLSHCTTG